MNYLLIALSIVMCWCINLVAHAPKGGLFKAFAAHKMKKKIQEEVSGRETFEMRSNGVLSNVYVVNGMKEFKRLVTSNPLPVVVKVHAAVSASAESVKGKFQSIADTFSKDTMFVSIDIMSKVNNKAENQQIIGTLMAQSGIFNVQLPVFLFFNHGALAQPIAILQGEESLNRMTSAIQSNFSTHNVNQGVVHSMAQGAVQGMVQKK